MKKITALSILLFFIQWSYAQKGADKAINGIEKQQAEYADIAMKIWNLAEVGYQEVESSKLLKENLKAEGFTIEENVAGIPTAFIASYGTGKPVIGILGEFDALPGISQKAVPHKDPLVEGGAGHACGHHLFGTASVAAAVAIKDWLKVNKGKGTIRFYGTPAEEGGSGKVYMVREGLFEDVDAVINWHPGNVNSANQGTTLANKTGKFRFYGVSSHAAGAPERGRSALDAVEAMNMMVNMMREHTTDGTRIHYVITKGGSAPNVVPDYAEVYYYVRHIDNAEVLSLWNRLENAAKGAALGTDTEVKIEVIGGVYSLLPNITLGKVMYESLKKVGGYTYTNEEKEFATKISETLNKNALPLNMTESIVPFEKREGKGSTDVGDVSWTVPTVGLSTATWVPGTSAHSWQAVAAGGTTIGIKGMMMAAKAMALTGITLFSDPAILDEAKKEFDKKRGPDFQYTPMLGDRKPALDYRN